MAIETVIAAHATIGESPTWVSSEDALYWIDVKQPALHRLGVSSGRRRSWTVSSDIGGFALTEDGGAVVALREGLFRLDLGSGALTCLAPAPFDQQLFRFNEGACDPTGRFWIGVMYDPLSDNSDPQAGSLYSFTLSCGLRIEPDAAELHNGMAWSADGSSFFLSHSYARTIYRHAFDPASGRIGARQVFATVQEADGIPDGSAIDVEGGYWCALHGGHALRRYKMDGSIDRDVPLAVSQPTMCAFAGTDLETLYITSAAEKTDFAIEPEAGNLFRFEPGVAGIPRRAFIR